jgi:hypothetical protein
MNKKISALIALVILGLGSQAKPITIKRMGGYMGKTVTSDDEYTTATIDCGNDMGKLCFTMTYDDGTVAAKPQDIKPGFHPEKAKVVVSESNGEVLADGLLSQYHHQLQISVSGRYYTQTIFKLKSDKGHE